MTKIDFHILPTDQESELIQYVIRLIQKALHRKHQVLIATESESQSKQISERLWAQKPDSFMAHNFIDEPYFQLQISHSNQCGHHHDVLINYCDNIPEYFSRFERVIEIVSQQTEALKSSRQRYKYYNDRGYSIARHDLRDRI